MAIEGLRGSHFFSNSSTQCVGTSIIVTLALGALALGIANQVGVLHFGIRETVMFYTASGTLAFALVILRCTKRAKVLETHYSAEKLRKTVLATPRNSTDLDAKLLNVGDWIAYLDPHSKKLMIRHRVRGNWIAEYNVDELEPTSPGKLTKAVLEKNMQKFPDATMPMPFKQLSYARIVKLSDEDAESINLAPQELLVYRTGAYYKFRYKNAKGSVKTEVINDGLLTDIEAKITEIREQVPIISLLESWQIDQRLS